MAIERDNPGDLARRAAERRGRRSNPRLATDQWRRESYCLPRLLAALFLAPGVALFWIKALISLAWAWRLASWLLRNSLCRAKASCGSLA